MSEATNVRAMRQPTLETLGLGCVLDIFRRGALPVDAAALVDRVFGPAGARGSLVISGANGIVGAGKAMQLGSRLQPYGVRVVALDFPGAPDGIGRQYPGLVQAMGRDGAARVMSNIVRLTYDGKTLPDELKALRPRFLLEAIPEILEVKRAHYEVFRAAFPGIEIRSVTSGFPASSLGVGIAHPAFPHEVNKMWEVVEKEPSAVTQLMWALGMIPLPVGDHWSFVLDVIFCGVTHAGLRLHRRTNMPFWKIDKLVRRLVGANPFRAHDVIGAKGANFLTWSCLHHLGKEYGDVFEPTPELTERKDTGQAWYPPDHFRPLVDWTLSPAEKEEFRVAIQGPLFQMASLMLHERRAHLSHLNAIGETCAQFRHGIVAMLRETGAEKARQTVAAYHATHPEAAKKAWHPEAFDGMDRPEWQQLYVNAEHDGKVGVVTLSRESYSWDVDREMNRALDWLRAAGIRRVIVTHDFHLATQLVGADTADFFPALHDAGAGFEVSSAWTRTARRLWNDFESSVGFIGGKRCLGGMYELLMHCHHVVAVDDARIGFPEVGLPVVPGMEGCHWTLRRAPAEHWPKVMNALLSGAPVRGKDGVGWLVDAAGPMDQALRTAWALASGTASGPARRPLAEGPLSGVPTSMSGLPAAEDPLVETGRKAILDCVTRTCAVSAAEAADLQSRISAEFLASKAARDGRVGSEFSRVMGA
jgi:enoyl-CoA hydratase/carnithine racemase/3-hydroxyacyl-CoA dehydrogenase